MCQIQKYIWIVQIDKYICPRRFKVFVWIEIALSTEWVLKPSILSAFVQKTTMICLKCKTYLPKQQNVFVQTKRCISEVISSLRIKLRYYIIWNLKYAFHWILNVNLWISLIEKWRRRWLINNPKICSTFYTKEKKIWLVCKKNPTNLEN